ncbi:CDP-alcohol phosphatidyltransferase family protein [Persephonella atlantica]|uniref:CDP-diacylglycerol--glycerol-3-phosphate 3-phosphatidyltransferase n=1 Tax=Persephonella atlantica TaxID=2699429 RepID=A0ABS1GG23_9AQUI|nr:CDP-alcohol phosphatidyltransferase family protein [Persephonella atlantica]MBK3331874.1 CDP-alcohol phosphatidyltransferase family protein [Persephonella atlantica]
MNFANQITILRIFLIPVFIILIGYNKPLYALIVFVVAGLTDALDGFVARRFNQITTLGKILDPIADKALLISSFVFIYTSALTVKFPYWYVVIVISRDIYILLGSALIYFLKGYLDVKPSVFGKATTFFQILSVITVLVANITVIPDWAVWGVIYTATFFTVLSTLTYTYDGIQQLK